MAIKAGRWIQHILLFSTAFGLSFLLFLQLWVKDTSNVVLPDFRTLTQQQAEALASSLLIGMELEPAQFSLVHPKGVVMHQKPKPGVTVVQGRSVALTYSKGVEENWTSAWIGQVWAHASDAFAKMEVTAQLYETCSGEKPGTIAAITHDSKNKIVHVLLVKDHCGQGWIVKKFGSNQYRDIYQKELAAQHMTLQWAGDLHPSSRVETNPPAGSVIYSGDTLWIRKAKP